MIDWVDNLETLEYDLARALKYLVEGEDRKIIGWTVENQELNLFFTQNAQTALAPS